MRRISLRLPDELHAQVVEAAGTDRRSMHAELLWLIEWGLSVRSMRAAFGQNETDEAKP